MLFHTILTKTTQITPYQYINFFSKLLNEGYSILYLSLSSGLSSTYQSAMLAASELNDEHKDEKVYVVDSLGATGGIGVLLELACKYRKEGKNRWILWKISRIVWKGTIELL